MAQRSRGTDGAFHFDGVFDGEWDAFEGAEGFSRGSTAIDGFGFAESGFAEDFDCGVEGGIDLIDAREVRVNEFDGRDLALADLLGLSGAGKGNRPR
jgi:hypothetical protein